MNKISSTKIRVNLLCNYLIGIKKLIIEVLNEKLKQKQHFQSLNE